MRLKIGHQARIAAKSDASLAAMTKVGTLGVQFVLIVYVQRLIIAEVGIDAFGFVSMLSSLSLLLPVVALGVGASVTNRVAAGDKTAARRTVVTSVRTIFVSFAACFVVWSAVVIGPGWGVIFNVPSGLSEGLNRLVLLLVVILFVFLIGQLGTSIFIGLGLVHRANLYQLVAAPLAMAACIVLIRLNTVPLSYALVLPFGNTGASLYCLWAALKRIDTSVTAISLEVFNPRARGAPIRAESLPAAVIGATLPVGTQTHRLLIAHLGSASALANYSLVSVLFAPAANVLSSMSVTLWPRFARERQAGKATGIIQATIVFAGVGMCAAGTIFFLGPLVVGLLAPNNTVPASVFGAFGLLIFMQSVQNPVGYSLMDAQGLRFQAVLAICMVTAALVAIAVSVGNLGAAGPPTILAVCIFVFQTLPSWWYARARERRRRSSCNASLPTSS